MTMQASQPGVSVMKLSRMQRLMPSREQGVALFVGLIFLVILSLVALVAMRGTLLDMRMTTATARHEQAFEASEAARAIPEAVLANHVYNRGWPASWGGNVPDALFDLNTTFANRLAWINLLNPNTTSGQGLKNSCAGSLVIFYIAVTCATRTNAYNYTPTQWEKAATFLTCANGTTGSSTTCPSGQQVTNSVSIIRDGVSINKGAGAAQAQGYSSVGVGSSKGGSALLLQLRSDSTVPGGGEAVTIAQYKLNISH
jgi:hypothetical protein